MQSIRQTILQTIPASQVWCTNSFEFGVVECPKKEALPKKHIQINPHHCKAWLSLDVDRAGGAFAFDDLHIEPSFTTVNPDNKHAHHHFKLEKPIFLSDAKALTYFNDVRKALTCVIGADMAYSGFITKNPMNPSHHTLQRLETHCRAFTLHDLVDCLPDKLSELVKEADRLKERQIESGEGRNSHTFESLRKWAYHNVRHYRDKPSCWVNALTDQATRLNLALGQPLSSSELLGIVRSVGNFVQPNSGRDKIHAQAFSDAQKRRAKIGVQNGNLGKANAARVLLNEDKRVSARLMATGGMSTRAIASELGINQSTVVRWLKDVE